MTLLWVDSGMLDKLEHAAAASPRKRQHFNLHRDYSDPSQRLLNHVGTDSYIRPHRHLNSGCDETLVAIKGLFGIVTFDDDGEICDSGRFGSELHASPFACRLAVVVEPHVWHSVLALTPGAVLLECKAGPFDPNAAKELALWAPEEGSSAAVEYFRRLRDGLQGRETT
jgi:cupin fold WbuC family metalloprotein